MANEQDRSRIENLLLRILGENVDLEEPLSRIEDLLYQVADIIVTLDSQGLIPINEIPPAAIEHMVAVANDTARFALTTDDVNNGDTVYVDATKVMYMVIDDAHLDSETGYKEYSAGIATKAIADQLGNVINTYYQRLIDSSNKLSADLVDDSSATNKFTNATEKETWNGKQDAIDSSHKLSADLVDDTNSTNKFTNATEKQTWNGKQDPLVFETAYDASTNKAATVADIPTSGSSTPQMDSTASAGSSTTWSRSDHVHPSDTSKQNTIDSSHKLSADLVDDTNSTNKFTDATEKQTWNGKQDTTLATWTPGSATSHSTPAVGDTLTEALQKIDNNQRLDETNISSLQQAVGYANTELEGVL